MTTYSVFGGMFNLTQLQPHIAVHILIKMTDLTCRKCSYKDVVHLYLL